MLAAAFMAGFVVFGVLYSFGVFLDPIMADFGAGRPSASAYYAIASLVFYMLGPFTGRFSDRFGPQHITAVGALAMGAGLIGTAFIGDVWTGCLVYGLGVGVGAACAHIPTFANVGGWFDRWRTRALGIAVAGTGCGMLVVPPVAAILIGAVGWRQANIVLGVLSALVLGLCALAVRPAPALREAPSSRSLRTVLQSKPFQRMYVSWVLATMALFVPMVFLPAFAVQGGADPVSASWLISILGGTSIAGRICIGYVDKRIGVVELYKLSVLAMAASYVLWLLLPGFGWLMAFAAVLGFAYGVRIALVAPVMIEFFGLKDFGAILGVFFTASGLAGLLGPLIAGFVVDASGGYAAGIFAAVVMGGLGYAAIIPLRRA